jgi:ankyrin repeat protein
VEQVTRDGKTAMMFAVEVGRTDAIAALVRRGALLDKEGEGAGTLHSLNPVNRLTAQPSTSIGRGRRAGGN